MSDVPIASRLDAVPTRWSLIRQAHGNSTTAAVDARRALVLRYAPAIKSYIRGITRSETEADERAQEVVVRLMQGDFAGADPNRGRFRDFLKTAVRNIVRKHWSREKRRATVDLEAEPVSREAGEPFDPWEEGWRNRVMELAWAALKEHEERNPQSLAWTLLKLRASFPNDSSEQLADRLAEETGQPVRADAVRQKLRRARVHFAECLVRELADGLEIACAESIEEELMDLNLHSRLRSLLPKNWGYADRQ